MNRFRPSLTVSILSFLGLLLLLTWLLFSLLAFKTAANDLYAQKGEYARSLLKAFASLLPDSIPTYPEGFLPPDSQASRFIEKLSEESTFSRLTLLDRNGKIIYSAGQEGTDLYAPFQAIVGGADGSFIRPDGGGVVHIVSIVRDGANVGKAGLLLSLAPERARLSRSRQILIAYFALDFILLCGLGTYVLTRIVVNPVNRILTATEKITGGQYSHRLAVTGSAELARLAAAFNDMAKALGTKDDQVREQLTALEQANRELNKAREETIRSEKLASIGLLAAGMAHEIGTPLASIMGYAELTAGEQADNPSVSDYARRITEDCTRIDRIVRGLLDYSRPRTLSSESADVREVVLQAVELLEHQGALKQMKVELSIRTDLPPVRCDRHQLQQVVINLLLNGRDAMQSDGIMTISALRDGTFIKLDVADSGSGITEDALKHIFDPFFTTKPPGKGTGLGLSISARIVEGFGGTISVASAVGHGSCFSVRLPVEMPGKGEHV